MPETARDKVHVCNRALLKLGQPASYTIDSGEELGAILDMGFDAVEARAIALYRWSNSIRTQALEALAAGTFDNGWTYGFNLPANRIGNPVAFLSQAGANEIYCRSFMIEEGKVYANVSALWARIRLLADPTTWDLGFMEAFVTALAGEIAEPLLQQEDTGERYKREAWGSPQQEGGGGLFGKLIALDHASQPQGRNFLQRNPLTDARA